MNVPDATLLRTIPNPEPDRDYCVDHVTEEFTFLYPLTDQPCFGRVEISYLPDASCIETMSLKQYLNTYREESFSLEAVTNRVLDDLQAACLPREARVKIGFNVRGGIETTVTVEVRS